MAASTVPGFLESSIVSPGTAAMMLALTQTIYDEDLAKAGGEERVKSCSH